MKNNKSLGLSIVLMPIIPLISIFFFSPSRFLYFDTKTTVPTNAIGKISILLIAIALGLNFTQALKSLTKIKILQNFKSHHFLPTLAFILFVLMPNMLAEFNLELPAKLIYKIFRVSYLSPPFADFKTIIYGISCPSVHHVGDLISCDPRNSQFVTWNYPSILLKLRFAAFLFENISLVVILVSIFFVILIYVLSLKQSKIQNLFLTGIILSPPFLLCFGRLNFDLFILCFIWLGIHFLQSQNSNFKELSWILFLISGLLKFYGLAAYISVIYNFRLKKFFTSLTFLLIGVLLISNDIPHLQNSVGKDIYGSVGFPVIAAFINGWSIASLNLVTYGSIMIAIYILLYVRFIKNRELIEDEINGENLIIFVFGFIFLFTWFTTSNYYYRLLLLVPILLVLVKNKPTAYESSVISSTFFSFFLSPKVFGALQNLFLLPIICFLIVKIFYVFRRELRRTLGRRFIAS